MNKNPLNTKPAGNPLTSKPSTETKPADAGKVVETKPSTETTTKPKRDYVGTPNEVFLEILPDERISRHKALKLVRDLGLSCSQARMAEIIELKYGPEPEREKKNKNTSTSKIEREKKRKEAEEKALAIVRAKREAAKKGEPVDGYKAEVYVAAEDPAIKTSDDSKLDEKAKDPKSGDDSKPTEKTKDSKSI